MVTFVINLNLGKFYIGVDNVKKRVCFMCVFILMLSGCAKPLTPQVTVKEAVISDTLTINDQSYNIDGHFGIFVNMDIIHPGFAEYKASKGDALTLPILESVVYRTTFIVIKRNDKIVYVIGELFYKDYLYNYYNKTEYLSGDKKLTDIGYVYFIPDEYKNDDIHFMITKINGFGFNSTTRADGTQSVSYTQPNDVWFDFTEFTTE